MDFQEKTVAVKMSMNRKLKFKEIKVRVKKQNLSRFERFKCCC